MNRIKDIPPAEMTNEQTAVFEQLTAGRGRILTPYKVWIHSPKVASGMEHIGTFLNKKSSLSEREVEIGILVIARHWHADYVLQAHIRMAHDRRSSGIRDRGDLRRQRSQARPTRTSVPSTRLRRRWSRAPNCRMRNSARSKRC